MGWRFIAVALGIGLAASACEEEAPPTADAKPIAEAGLDMVVIVGQEIRLNGARSHDDRADVLQFNWSIIEKPERSSAQLFQPTSPRPSIIIDHAKQWAFQLIVSDGTNMSEPDIIRVRTLNRPPVANAGIGYAVEVGDVVSLDGSGSYDEDFDELRYTWKMVTRPGGSVVEIDNADTVTPSFRTDAMGIYTVELVVNDGEEDSAPVRARIRSGVPNFAPIANAGGGRRIRAGTAVSLDGSASRDEDGDPLTFMWRVGAAPGGSVAQVVGGNTPMPVFTPDRAGTYGIELVVHDGTEPSPPSTVEVLACDPVMTSGSGELCSDDGQCTGCTKCFRGVCVREESVRVSLTWWVQSDFDLHVETPSGAEIFFGNPRAEGLELDVDDCVGTCRRPDIHVENVFFSGNFASGTYTVWVVNYSGESLGNFALDVAGDITETWMGQLPQQSGATSQRYMFVVP